MWRYGTVRSGEEARRAEEQDADGKVPCLSGRLLKPLGTQSCVPFRYSGSGGVWPGRGGERWGRTEWG
ncbi:hypothetical protein E2C01_086806 [Portunus trituberculatus]|uniref:Uncharacterized protein n=1 Tax=Portunus trituberculatus TaxID=210409 RepID=A0A5B7JAA3_PORTR|nr:hypothetical protein [Portunus trituberculatus]